MRTSNYKNCDNDYRNVSISGDRGKEANYIGECYPDLAPKKEFWSIWHNNIGIISEEENTKYYVEEYYKQVLSKLDPSKVHHDLEDKILLCYEDPDEFCHRHIVASWIKLLFEEEVPEVKVVNNVYQEVDIKECFDDLLESIMRENTPNMRGFTSFKALRLFEEGEKLEALAEKLEEEKKDIPLDGYYMTAAGLRVQADDAEEEYRNKKQRKRANK